MNSYDLKRYAVYSLMTVGLASITSCRHANAGQINHEPDTRIVEAVIPGQLGQYKVKCLAKLFYSKDSTTNAFRTVPDSFSVRGLEDCARR